jgi:hypothetical protein
MASLQILSGKTCKPYICCGATIMTLSLFPVAKCRAQVRPHAVRVPDTTVPATVGTARFLKFPHPDTRAPLTRNRQQCTSFYHDLRPFSTACSRLDLSIGCAASLACPRCDRHQENGAFNEIDRFSVFARCWSFRLSIGSLDLFVWSELRPNGILAEQTASK